MTQEITTPRIYEYITKSTWLHFEDSLQIGKLKLFAGKYQNGSGATATVTHYIDAAAARPHLHDMLWSKPIQAKDYKGQTRSGQTTSRVLSINTAEKGYYFELSTGPGKETPTGAVMPAGKATESVNVFIPFDNGRQIAADLLEYLQAHRTIYMMRNYDPSLLDRPTNPTNTAVTINDQEEPETPAETTQPGQSQPNPADFDQMFPREPQEPETAAKKTPAHGYKYKNRQQAPNDPKTRAIFDAYFQTHRRAPASGPALKEWWNKNKPADDAPAES